MSGTAGTQGECRAEKETEEEIIQRCISHLDTDYSCRLAKQMEREKTNPVLVSVPQVLMQRRQPVISCMRK